MMAQLLGVWPQSDQETQSVVQRMLALEPVDRLDSSSALAQFDALWSRPAPARGKQDSPTSK